MSSHFCRATKPGGGLFRCVPFAQKSSSRQLFLPAKRGQKQLVNTKWKVVPVTMLPLRTLLSSGWCAVTTGKLRRDNKMEEYLYSSWILCFILCLNISPWGRKSEGHLFEKHSCFFLGVILCLTRPAEVLLLIKPLRALCFFGFAVFLHWLNPNQPPYNIVHHVFVKTDLTVVVPALHPCGQDEGLLKWVEDQNGLWVCFGWFPTWKESP